MKLSRDRIKWVRDGNKRRYQKDSKCAICGTTLNLEFHHYTSLTLLFNKWLRDNKIVANTDDEVLAIRERFSNEHKKELFDLTVTLCKEHHARLHKVYSPTPSLGTELKQMRWVSIQAAKLGIKYEYQGMVTGET